MRRVGAESKLSTASPAWADRRLLRPGFPVCRVLRRTHRKVGPTAERSRLASGRKGPRRRARYGSRSTCIAVPAGSARRSLALACRRCRGGIAREVPAALLGRALVKVCGPSRCTGRGLAQQRNGRLRLEVGMPAVAFLIGLGKDTAVDGDDWNRPLKSSHAASALDTGTHATLTTMRVGATLAEYRRLPAWGNGSPSGVGRSRTLAAVEPRRAPAASELFRCRLVTPFVLDAQFENEG
jgi:hypothetical protein